LVDVEHKDNILRSFILFIQAAHAVLKYADARFYQSGISLIKFIALQALELNGGTMMPSHLAEWTFRERHDISTLVDRLERDGFVSTERSHEVRRFVKIILTGKGREALARTLPAAKEVVAQTMCSVTDSDALMMEKLLRTLRQNARDALKRVL